MAPELAVQLALLILTLAMFFAVLKLPKQALTTKLRSRNRSTVQSTRHLAQASSLLDRARTSPHRAQSQAQAKNALAEAEKALSLSPRDPAAHILKALALDLMDRRSSALRSLDLALSPPCVKSLSGRERGDALLKRAELKLAVNRRRRIDSAVQDLVESVRLSDGDGESKALCLLGQCYELKGMKEPAREAYEKALRVEPGSVVARQGLDRLGV
ncbi:N-terminal acetyltransferase A, auxiliary subunit [Trema orientale]|uniref:N-terminal acetyltransferase A, auxiliary subunit n=1 Tax=Trema orientale TaxID=63057 RepID=A0A2P5EGS4_TREOI|nr:N-terminal acetyltransferase A, auxiliary subunit [Trema orientale]